VGLRHKKREPRRSPLLHNLLVLTYLAKGKGGGPGRARRLEAVQVGAGVVGDDGQEPVQVGQDVRQEQVENSTAKELWSRSRHEQERRLTRENKIERVRYYAIKIKAGAETQQKCEKGIEIGKIYYASKKSRFYVVRVCSKKHSNAMR